MTKTYRIYRLENKTSNDVVFKFFLPEEGDVDTKTALSRKVKRLNELHDLKKKGYAITADILTDKEDYLNARLSVAVSDYCDLDHNERYTRIFRHKYTSDVYCRTLELILDSKRVTMKRIVSLVRRLNSEDLSIHNELAIILYDQYIKEICERR